MDAAIEALRPIVPGLGVNNLHDHLIAGGCVEQPYEPMGDDEFHQIIRDKMEKIDKNAFKTIEQLEDEQADDDTLEKYRKIRLQEMKEMKEKEKYGELTEITALEFEEEVKKSDELCCMLIYLRDHRESDILKGCLESLASKFKFIKFLKIVAGESLMNFLPEDCPTLMLYNKGDVVGQLVKLDAFAGYKTTPDVVEWELSERDILDTDLDEDPRENEITASMYRQKANFVYSSSNKRDVTIEERREDGTLVDDDKDSDDDDW